MTFREKIAVRLLLLVARMFTDDPAIEAEIKALSTHIFVAKREEMEERVAA
jgi:hypothetical protein